MYPRTDEQEQENINSILLYTDLAQRHKKLKTFISAPFIWEMCSYVKLHHKTKIMEKKLFTPKKFIAFLQDITESLDIQIRTRPEKVNNQRGEGPEGKSSRPYHKGGMYRPPQQYNRSQQNVTAFKPAKCNICKEDHPTFRCDKLANLKKEDLENLAVCPKCLCMVGIRERAAMIQRGSLFVPHME